MRLQINFFEFVILWNAWIFSQNFWPCLSASAWSLSEVLQTRCRSGAHCTVPLAKAASVPAWFAIAIRTSPGVLVAPGNFKDLMKGVLKHVAPPIMAVSTFHTFLLGDCPEGGWLIPFDLAEKNCGIRWRKLSGRTWRAVTLQKV